MGKPRSQSDNKDITKSLPTHSRGHWVTLESFFACTNESHAFVFKVIWWGEPEPGWAELPAQRRSTHRYLAHDKRLPRPAPPCGHISGLFNSLPSFELLSHVKPFFSKMDKHSKFVLKGLELSAVMHIWHQSLVNNFPSKVAETVNYT